VARARDHGLATRGQKLECGKAQVGDGPTAAAWRSARVSRPRRLARPTGLPRSRHRLGVTRRPRGAGRGSPDPAGLPDRQVSRAHRRPRFQRCSCLLSLLQTKETYRSGIWAGSGDHCGEDLRQVQHPGKTAFSAELSRFFMACPGKCLPKELILQPSEFEKSLVFKRDFDFLKMFTAVVRRPAPSAGSCLRRGQETRAQRGRVPGWHTTNNCATSKRAGEGRREFVAARARPPRLHVGLV
jgi:hypothetical protein